MSHTAQAVALTCIDFRFRKALHNFFENELKLETVDHKADAGGVKMLLEEGPVQDWILKNLEIAFKLHGVNKVILVNHQDCGVYGGSKAFENEEKEISFQEANLKQATAKLKEKYPDKEILAYLALIKNEQVSFKKVV